MRMHRPLARTIIRLMLAAFALLALSAPTHAETDAYSEGLAAFEQGDYAETLTIIEPLARDGDAKAQALLAVMYDNGLGVSQSQEEAARWYGFAAAQGDAYSQHMLGRMYHLGRGVPQDDELSARWMQKAAEQGNIQSQRSLGAFYHEGIGVEQNQEAAFHWFEQAAWQGDTESQLFVGLAYARGDGVHRDPIQAYMWLSVAEANGQESAKKWKEQEAQEMNPKQLEAAKKHAAEWRRKGPEHFQ
ncbi:sel1 repeat family protein [Oceanidesulfovibrio marinus]|uniref:Sel1 repeat family protein n=2 Tax=Oceanidesulfovibrio marinus TaxID=370038 RepID=A0A6P1ZFU1_9BACT|nr:sel1 repeat family protein [Oceanidesulfovibrio marinus]